MLSAFAAENAVGERQHLELLERAGWTEAEYAAGVQQK